MIGKKSKIDLKRCKIDTKSARFTKNACLIKRVGLTPKVLDWYKVCKIDKNFQDLKKVHDWQNKCKIDTKNVRFAKKYKTDKKGKIKV